jgi:hypothetical protein
VSVSAVAELAWAVVEPDASEVWFEAVELDELPPHDATLTAITIATPLRHINAVLARDIYLLLLVVRCSPGWIARGPDE